MLSLFSFLIWSERQRRGTRRASAVTQPPLTVGTGRRNNAGIRRRSAGRPFCARPVPQAVCGGDAAPLAPLKKADSRSAAGRPVRMASRATGPESVTSMTSKGDMSPPSDIRRQIGMVPPIIVAAKRDAVAVLFSLKSSVPDREISYANAGLTTKLSQMLVSKVCCQTVPMLRRSDINLLSSSTTSPNTALLLKAADVRRRLQNLHTLTGAATPVSRDGRTTDQFNIR
jgi:hypothetical protein